MRFNFKLRYLLGLLLILSPLALGHNISASNAQFVQGLVGPAIAPFMYLGAKHMVTGIDHLLFIVGVIFFLHQTRDILIYVTLFTLGHSLTLIMGVLLNMQANASIIDAIIGFSIVYKAFENIGGFRSAMPFRLDTRVAVFIFGLCHGLGLATKLTSFSLSEAGLLTNLIGFNVGVEVGQFSALAVMLVVLGSWRRLPSFERYAFSANVVLMIGGFLLMGYHTMDYLLT
ncbi:MAG: HupE/UreJ family protein [Pseudomonadales bacterium]